MIQDGLNNVEDDDVDLEINFKLVKRAIEVEVSWESLGKTRTIKINTIRLIPVS